MVMFATSWTSSVKRHSCQSGQFCTWLGFVYSPFSSSSLLVINTSPISSITRNQHSVSQPASQPLRSSRRRSARWSPPWSPPWLRRSFSWLLWTLFSLFLRFPLHVLFPFMPYVVPRCQHYPHKTAHQSLAECLLPLSYLCGYHPLLFVYCFPLPSLLAFGDPH